jgi:hypothetical protein
MAQIARMFGAEIQLIRCTVHAESDGFVGWAAGEVVLELHFNFPHEFPRMCAVLLARSAK